MTSIINGKTTIGRIEDDKKNPDSSLLYEGDFDEQEIVKAVVWNFDESLRAASSINTKRERVRKCYNNDYSHLHEGKADWQSRRNFPVVKLTVEKFAASLSRMFALARKDWFILYSSNVALKPFFSLFNAMLQDLINHPKVKFPKLFQQVVTSACLNGNYSVFVSWRNDGGEFTYDVPKQEEDELFQMFPGLEEMVSNEMKQLDSFMPSAYPHIVNDDPMTVLLDPSGRHRFVIRYSYYTIGEYETMSENFGWDYVDDVAASKVSSFKGILNKYSALGVASNKITQNDNVKVVEFWGNLYDDQGYMLREKAHIVVVNDEFLVYSDTNGFAHGDIPVIYGGLLETAQMIYPDSHVSSAIDTLEGWVQFMNMMIDFYRTRITPQFERNTTVIDPSFLTDKDMAPGAYIDKTGPEPAITAVALPDLAPGYWQFLSTFKTQIGDDTGLHDIGGEIQMAQPSTADEYRRKKASADVLLDNAFVRMEDNLLVPLLRQLFYNMLQFTPQEEWDRWVQHKVARHIEKTVHEIPLDQYDQITRQNPEMAPEDALKKYIEDTDGHVKLFKNVIGMDVKDRLRVFGSQINFKTEILSAVFERTILMEKITFLMSIIGQNPMFMAYATPSYILKKAYRLANFEEDEAINTDKQAFDLLKVMSSFGIIKGGKLTSGDTETPSMNSGGQELGAAPANNSEGMAEASLGMPGAEAGGMPVGFNLPMP